MIYPPPIINEIVHGLHLANIARYLSLGGLVALLYDHVLTLDQEIRLIWKAPNTFVKWMFLVTRYLSEGCLLALANEMSGFSQQYDDIKCKKLMITISCIGITATLTADLVAFLRVIVLWDKSPRLVLFLFAFLTLSFVVTIGTMIAALIIIAPSIQYEPITQLCWLSKSSPSLIAVWLAPTGFGLTVLVLTAYNALSLPRSTESPLSRILHRDGMAFFVASLLLRCTNVVFMTLTSPGMVGLPIFCVWAIDLIGINRFLIHVRSSESDSQYDETREIVMSPVSRASADDAHDGSKYHDSTFEPPSFWLK